MFAKNFCRRIFSVLAIVRSVESYWKKKKTYVKLFEYTEGYMS